MSEQDIETLMTLAQKEPRDYALIRLMASTGFRVSDIVRVLRVKMEKTDRWVERALRDDAREVLKTYLATRGDSHPRLIISQSQRTKFHLPGPLSRSAVHLIIKKYLAVIYPESVIQQTATHVLRRSIAKLINRKTGRIETAPPQRTGARRINDPAATGGWMQDRSAEFIASVSFRCIIRMGLRRPGGLELTLCILSDI